MPDEIKIITNNHPRPILDSSELTLKEREEFDYYDWAKLEAGDDSASFFRYKGQVYDLGEFTRCVYFPGWDGIHTDTYFSGVLVRYGQPDMDYIIVGRCYS